MARMKIWTNGKYLWTRTIGSTVVGQGFDSLIFYPLAFYGAPGWPTHQILLVMLSQFILKTSWEAVLTPVTYAVVGALKRREGVDVYDRRSEEHTSELQSLMRISYAVFCLKKNTHT